MTGTEGGTDGDGGADPDREADAESPTDADADGDTFGVGIHVTEAEFQFVVHVPSDIASGWDDSEAFQRLVEQTVWDRLDRDSTLREIDRRAEVGETVTLGRITLRPDGTVVDASLREDVAES